MMNTYWQLNTTKAYHSSLSSPMCSELNLGIDRYIFLYLCLFYKTGTRLKKASDYVDSLRVSWKKKLLYTGQLFLMGHNRMSLPTVMRLIVMQDHLFAVMGCENGRWDLGYVDLLCCTPILLIRMTVPIYI
jgi:hypothetical protein